MQCWEGSTSASLSGGDSVVTSLTTLRGALGVVQMRSGSPSSISLRRMILRTSSLTFTSPSDVVSSVAATSTDGVSCWLRSDAASCSVYDSSSAHASTAVALLLPATAGVVLLGPYSMSASNLRSLGCMVSAALNNDSEPASATAACRLVYTLGYSCRRKHALTTAYVDSLKRFTSRYFSAKARSGCRSAVSGTNASSMSRIASRSRMIEILRASPPLVSPSSVRLVPAPVIIATVGVTLFTVARNDAP